MWQSARRPAVKNPKARDALDAYQHIVARAYRKPYRVRAAAAGIPQIGKYAFWNFGGSALPGFIVRNSIDTTPYGCYYPRKGSYLPLSHERRTLADC